MKCTRTDSSTESRLTLEGAFDAQTAPEVRPIFDALVDARPKRVVVDLERVAMIDSYGIGMLVSLCKRVRANGGEVVVVGAQEQPLVVIRVLKLEQLFGLDRGGVSPSAASPS